MEKVTNEIMQLISELHMLEAGRKDKNAEKDRYGFSFEPMNCVSTVPLDFTERTMRLQVEAREAYRLTLKLNRHSPLFIRTSGLLERLLNHLGSYCITKAVLESQGETFNMIDTLDIERLREITAANFRKCNDSFIESQMVGHFNTKIFALSLRWAELDRRLEATAEKIEKIKSGKIKIDLTEKESSADPQKASAKEQTETTASLPEKGTALPIDKAAVRTFEKQKTAAGTTEKPAESEAESPERSEETKAVPAATETEETADAVLEEERAEASENKDEKYKRNILLQDAVFRADKDAYGAAYMARGPDLDLLWDAFMEREISDGFPTLSSMGIVSVQPESPPGEEPEEELAELCELETV